MLTIHFFNGKLTVVILEAFNFAKNDPATANLVVIDISLTVINCGQGCSFLRELPV